MAHVEPMDIDVIESDFDDKENAFQHNNVLSRTPCTEKGYEELDVSELNMKLRYSITPTSSPMTKSLTGPCLDNRNCNSDLINVVGSENGNLTRSLNSSLIKTESLNKTKVLPLQTLSTDSFIDSNRNSSMRRLFDTVDNNVLVISSTNDIDENLSVPSTCSSMPDTPEATTPTKEIPKSEGSPIMRGLKSVLSMFRPSQSPIPPPDDKAIKKEILSPIEINKSEVIQVSTPVASKQREGSTSKRSSPLKESLVFKDDLERELQWKDETTIYFKDEKIPVHKLFFNNPITEITPVTETADTAVECMDVSCNESISTDKTVTNLETCSKEVPATIESDNEFLDCESTFSKNDSNVIEYNNFDIANDIHVSGHKTFDVMVNTQCEYATNNTGCVKPDDIINCMQQQSSVSDITFTADAIENRDYEKEFGMSSMDNEKNYRQITNNIATVLESENEDLQNKIQVNKESQLQDTVCIDNIQIDITEAKPAIFNMSSKNLEDKTENKIDHVNPSQDTYSVIYSNLPEVNEKVLNSIENLKETCDTSETKEYIEIIEDCNTVIANNINNVGENSHINAKTPLTIDIIGSVPNIKNSIVTNNSTITELQKGEADHLLNNSEFIRDSEEHLDKIHDSNYVKPILAEEDTSIDVSPKKLTKPALDMSMKNVIDTLQSVHQSDSSNSDKYLGDELNVVNIDVEPNLHKLNVTIKCDDTNSNEKSLQMLLKDNVEYKDNSDILKSYLPSNALSGLLIVPENNQEILQLSMKNDVIITTSSANVPLPDEVDIIKNIVASDVNYDDEIDNKTAMTTKFTISEENTFVPVGNKIVPVCANYNIPSIVSDPIEENKGNCIFHRENIETISKSLLFDKGMDVTQSFINQSACVTHTTDAEVVNIGIENKIADLQMDADNISSQENAFENITMEEEILKAILKNVNQNVSENQSCENICVSAVTNTVNEIISEKDAVEEAHLNKVNYNVSENQSSENICISAVTNTVTENMAEKDAVEEAVLKNVNQNVSENQSCENICVSAVINTIKEIVSEKDAVEEAHLNKVNHNVSENQSSENICVTAVNNIANEIMAEKHAAEEAILKNANHNVSENKSCENICVTAVSNPVNEIIIEKDILKEAVLENANQNFLDNQYCKNVCAPKNVEKEIIVESDSLEEAILKDVDKNAFENQSTETSATAVKDTENDIITEVDSRNSVEISHVIESDLVNTMIHGDVNYEIKSEETNQVQMYDDNQQNISSKNEVDEFDEEIITSANNSPYVSVTDLAMDADKVLKDSLEEIDNRLATISKVTSSPAISPKIVSKGYNFNFDDIDDPFATKTKIRMSPPNDLQNLSSNPYTEETKTLQEVPKKIYNKRKSQPDRKRPTQKKNMNVTINDKVTNKEFQQNIEVAIDTPEDIVLNTISTSPVKDNATDSKSESFVTTFSAENANKSIVTGSNQVSSVRKEELQENDGETKCCEQTLVKSTEKSSSSSEQYFSIGTSSAESSSLMNLSKNVFNLPEIDDVNFNSFVTKSKIRLSPPPTEETISSLQDKRDVPNSSCVKIEQCNMNNTETIKNADHTFIKNVSSPNISNATYCSKSTDDINDTVIEVLTEDEDTIEGPFLETEDFKDNMKVSEVDNDMMNFDGTTEQEKDENLENGELFIDADAFEFLLNQNKNMTVLDSGKESLFLKFDPLFAKRISSDGILAALSKVQKKQSTPKKVTETSQQKLTRNDSPVAGPSKDNNICPAVEEYNEDSSSAVAKPMMVVNPAVSSIVTQKKPATPKLNRRSLTFTSPAMAVIDRLLSLSGNSSQLDYDTSIPQVGREHSETDMAITQLRELLAEKEINVHNLRSESKELKARLAALENQVRGLETESAERLAKINELNERLLDKTKVNKSMAMVVEEYERTIASLIAETEQDKKRNLEERERLIKERDEQTAHLTSMEVSFSDLHSKYEKSKQIILKCKDNEDIYRKSIQEFEQNFSKMQNNYELLKQHATSKLNHANQELEKMNRAHEAEVLKMNAMIKRKELHITSLEETLAQKTKANEELTAICDELINKVG